MSYVTNDTQAPYHTPSPEGPVWWIMVLLIIANLIILLVLD